MRAVRSKDTKPEMVVRRLVHGLGYRYRLHRSDLPGSPDLTFARLRKAIFVHGCFWHQHRCARGQRQPATNVAYWSPKLARNVARDRLACRRLRRLGWGVLTIWECEIGRADIRGRIARFLNA